MDTTASLDVIPVMFLNQIGQDTNELIKSSADLLNDATTSIAHVDKGIPISDELRFIFEIVNYVVLTGLISFCGMIANSISFIVFMRQGLTDSVTISLTALTISDFGALTTYLWQSICMNPFFAESGIPFNSPTIHYITAAWPHVCFARMSSFMTSYITFERCICIVMPLKVKEIITPRRTFFVVFTAYFLTIASVCPVFYAIGLGWVWNEAQNRTLIDLVYAPHAVYAERFSLFFNSFAHVTSFIFVIICSLFLVNGLREKSKWRQESSNTGKDNSWRDKKVMKMVLLVATVFIVCYFPAATNYILMTTSEEYSVVGRYKDLFNTVWSFLNVLKAINSSVNIFIYYKMSSKYRSKFRRLFRCAAEDDVITMHNC